MLNTTDTVQHKTARPSSLNIRRDVARNVLTGRCTRQWSVPNIVSCRIKTLAIIRGSRIYFFPILVGAIWFQVALLVKSSQVYFYHTFNVCHYLQITAWTVTANAYSLFVEILFSFSYLRAFTVFTSILAPHSPANRMSSPSREPLQDPIRSSV